MADDPSNGVPATPDRFGREIPFSSAQKKGSERAISRTYSSGFDALEGHGLAPWMSNLHGVHGNEFDGHILGLRQA